MQHLNQAELVISPRSTNRLTKYSASLSFLCFALHQFGPSYHLSFGSIGLLLTFIILSPRTRKVSLLMAATAVTLILTSYIFFVARYGDTEGSLRIARISLNAFLLFLLFSSRNLLPSPPIKLVAAVICALFAMVTYQNLVDPGFRTPAAWFALTGQDSEFLVFDRVSLRASGPYSEPSVLGMMFCCLFCFSLRFKARVSMPLSFLCAFGVLLSGSLLGLIGLFMLFLCAIRDGRVGKTAAVIGVASVAMIAILVIFLSGYGLAFTSRTYDESSFFDVSTQARVIGPFLLMSAVFSDLNILGFPGDIYTHYLNTGLYDSMGNFPGHNGFLGTILSFGAFGVLFVWLLFRQVVSVEEGVLLLIIGSQSGNFFSYEKVFLMIFVVLSVRGTVILGRPPATQRTTNPYLTT